MHVKGHILSVLMVATPDFTVLASQKHTLEENLDKQWSSSIDLYFCKLRFQYAHGGLHTLSANGTHDFTVMSDSY